MLDAQTIGDCPEFLSIGGMFKATPRAEAGRRIVYFEASNEDVDQQGEIIAAKALADSASWFRRFGNIDIDHVSLLGPKSGFADYPLYEIGQPIDVGQRDGSTFVKGELYRGDGPAAEKANMVWAGLTEVSPPQRWYPSVGGKVLAKSIERDDRGEAKRTLVTKVRWSNLAVSRTPVNQNVPTCATMPIGTFAKCWGVAGLDIGEAMSLTKALTAGYGTDSAGFTGGAALREQSLDRGVKDSTVGSYFDFRERMAKALREGAVGPKANSETMHAYAVSHFGLSHDKAAEHVERFVRDLSSKLKRT